MIKKFRDKGGLFGFFSGRSISSLQNEIEKYDIPCDFNIGVNHGFILDTNNNEIFPSFINEQDTLKFIDYLDEFPPSLYTLHNGY